MQFYEFVPCVVDHCDSQFPRSCSCCRQSFIDFHDFLVRTEAVGAPTSYDDDEPVGIFSFANCRCGSTVTIECADVGSAQYEVFAATLREDAARLRAPLSEVLVAMRLAVREEVLRRRA